MRHKAFRLICRYGPINVHCAPTSHQKVIISQRRSIIAVHVSSFSNFGLREAAKHSQILLLNWVVDSFCSGFRPELRNNYSFDGLYVRELLLQRRNLQFSIPTINSCFCFNSRANDYAWRNEISPSSYDFRFFLMPPHVSISCLNYISHKTGIKTLHEYDPSSSVIVHSNTVSYHDSLKIIWAVLLDRS